MAYSFYSIAQIEKIHGDRFAQYAKWLESGQMFKAEVETGWMCLNCGCVYHGTEAPDKCPVCHEEQAHFIRLSLVPFTDGGMAGR